MLPICSTETLMKAQSLNKIFPFESLEDLIYFVQRVSYKDTHID